ncbi:Mov34-domain-containing protein [Marasmius fiardii PR-910]|nr:Mov34-domain-containing protein [Marasmius fiardii PR-910]
MSSTSAHNSSYPQRRPSSIAELAQKARNNHLRENQNLKYYLKHAESNRREAFKYVQAGDLESAFISFARTASLILEMLPSHPDYRTGLDETQRANLNMNGQEILDNLGQLKRRISDRYELYRKEHPEIEESHQRALQAQNAYEGSRNVQPPSAPVEPEHKYKAQQQAQDRAAKLSEEVARLSVNDPQYNLKSHPTPATSSALASARRAALGPRDRLSHPPTSPSRYPDDETGQSARASALQSAITAAATTAPSYIPMPAPPKNSPYSIDYPPTRPNTNTAQPRRERPSSFVGPHMMPLESPTKFDAGDVTDSETSRTMSRAPSRNVSYPPPITTSTFSSMPRPENPIHYPQLMSHHQKTQGYAPSDHPLLSPTHTNLPSIPQPLHYNYPSIQHPYRSSPSAPLPRPPPPPPPSATSATVSSGPPRLKTVILPRSCLPRFLVIASVNTSRNRETCGLLLGREVRGKYVVSTLLIPKQHSTSDTCTMDEEELVMQFTEERGLITLGWIHTHPTQSCFMSSVDLHTQCSFQLMLPESFAVVCAPKSNPNFGIFRLTDPPGLSLISSCKAKEAFHPHPDQPIYTDADRGHVQMRDVAMEIVDLRN